MKYQTLIGAIMLSVVAALTLSQLNLVNVSADTNKGVKKLVTGPISGPVIIGRVSPCSNIGDIDYDQLVTFGDAEAALKIVAKIGPYKNPTPEQIRRADVDGNKKVSSVDALKIKRYVMYLDYTFTACAIKKPTPSVKPIVNRVAAPVLGFLKK